MYTSGFTIFAKKLHHKCSTGLYIGLWKCWNFQREAKLEQIIAIVTTHSVFLLLIDKVLESSSKRIVTLEDKRSWLIWYFLMRQFQLWSCCFTFIISKNSNFFNVSKGGYHFKIIVFSKEKHLSGKSAFNFTKRWKIRWLYNFVS